MPDSTLKAGDRRQSTDPFRDMVASACADPEATAAGWQVAPQSDPSNVWIEAHNRRARLPEQGWKLHVSAGVTSAQAVLERALPALLAEPVAFKVAASLHQLYELNIGDGGPGQAGKFITVYPADDDQAVRLAVALDRATRGLHGPPIPSDRPLRPGSLVHYRYGAFAERYLQTALGTVLAAVASPDGALVADRRGTTYAAPPWAVDPFESAGVLIKRPQPSLLIGGRYLAVALLNQSARNTVRLVVDTATGERRVLKQGHRHSGVEPESAAHARLAHEMEVLNALASNPHVPRVYDLSDHNGDPILVTEDCSGPTLEHWVMELGAQGRFLPATQIAAWGRELASLLAMVHERGFIYRDLKAPNVIVAPDGRLRLVDFETACRHHDADGVHDGGTPGYVSPQRAGGGPPTTSDDVYSLGALLYYIATGADPSHAPNRFALLERRPELINPALPSDLAGVIARCLEPDPDLRFQTMPELVEALAAFEARSVAHMTDRRPRDRRSGHDPHTGFREQARRLGDSLCRAAETVEDGSGIAWVSTYPSAHGLRLRDINCGAAGIVLALAEIVSEFDDAEHRRVLEDGARWLTTAPPFPGPMLPGLYVGEAGIGAALLRAGRVLSDDALLHAANEKGRLVASLPHRSPDLFNGSAGRLRFHLFLWDQTGDAEHLAAAVAAGDFLLQCAELPARDERRWRIPPGYEGASGQIYLGYAHGAAGIADALLDLFEATGDERYAEAVRGAGRSLARQALTTLDDGSGLDWPSVEGGRSSGGVWCHGATGIGRFFLHAARLGQVPEAATLAERAARTAAQGVRWAGPTQCHGLAGNIEFLLDMYQATGDRTHLDGAFELARLLQAFAVEGEDGGLLWSSQPPSVRAPDYLVGYAGIATCLLRLSAPERLPHLLSRAGFRARADLSGSRTHAAGIAGGRDWYASSARSMNASMLPR